MYVGKYTIYTWIVSRCRDLGCQVPTSFEAGVSEGGSGVSRGEKMYTPVI